MAEERDRATKCLRQLRNSLIDDEDLNAPIHDESFLIRFVRAKNYDAELAFETVKKYFKLRQRNQKLFKMAFPSHRIVKLILKGNSLLKNKDPLGRSIITFNNPSWEVKKFNLDHIVAAFLLVIEELLSTQMETQINGIVIVLNLKGLNVQQVQELSVRRIRYVMQIFQGSFPMRCKAIHVINEPKIFDLVLMAAKPFMTEKFTQRLMLHSNNLENFHQAIPAESLPSEYGGTLSEDEAYNKEFAKALFLRDEYYKKLQMYGYGSDKD